MRGLLKSVSAYISLCKHMLFVVCGIYKSWTLVSRFWTGIVDWTMEQYLNGVFE